MASGLFDGDFSSCMDKTYEEIDEDLKSYSSLTVFYGQIRLGLGNKNNIKAFIQWTRYQIRLVLDHVLTRFTVVNASIFIKRYKHHEAYI